MTIISLADVERRLRDVRSVALGGMLLENRPSTLVQGAAAGRGGRPVPVLGARGVVGCRRPARRGPGQPGADTAHIARQPGARAGHAAGGRRGHRRLRGLRRGILLGGYLAASDNVPIQVLHNLGTNDLVDGNPLLIRSGDLLGVGPLRVDVALLHAPLGDEEGNLVHFGSRWADLLIARSARHVIAQVDHVVPTAVAARLGVSIPGYLVDEVVEAPFGAHPLGSVGGYVADLDHLAAYQSTVNAGGFDDYLDDYCAIDHRPTWNGSRPRGCARLRIPEGDSGARRRDLERIPARAATLA